MQGDRKIRTMLTHKSWDTKLACFHHGLREARIPNFFHALQELKEESAVASMDFAGYFAILCIMRSSLLVFVHDSS